MAKPLRFDRVEVERLIREEGYTQKQCADHFGVSEASISKARREVRAGMTTAVALEAGHKVLIHNLDTLGQLSKINKDANEILTLMMKWQRGDDEALRIMESQIRKIKIGRGEKAEEVTEYKFKDPREIALKAMGEIREQLRLQVDIMKTLHDVTAIAEFQKEVLTTIGEANKCPACGMELIVCGKCGQKIDLRSLIIEKLKQARALRAGVQFRP
jgi:transcriptional regulator with XRE-family HTH domain